MRVLIVVMLMTVVSCKSRPDQLTFTEFEKWMMSEESELYKSKSINGVQVVSRFIPAAHSAYRELKYEPQAGYDSLLKEYQCGLTFQITLQADKSGPYNNLMYYELSGPGELAERTQFLSFNGNEFITLEYGSQSYEPVLSSFDGYNALANQLSFQVVFEIPKYKCGDTNREEDVNIKLTFKDPIWNLGTNHFSFEKKYLMDIPKIEF